MKHASYQNYYKSKFDVSLNIPSNWQEKRLKFVVSYNDESLPDTTKPDYEIEYVDISSVDLVNGITKYERLTFEKAPSRARRIARDGDTIVSTVRTYLKAIAAINNPPDNLIVSTGFAVIRPTNEIDKKYLSYYLQSQNFVELVVAYSVGVSYPAINPTDLVSLPICYPHDNKEQKNIAAFLDYKTEQIDKLVEKKKQLIKKLEEKRIAVITQAVTKGLDKNVKLKPSGVDWLGDVPEHWKVDRIKFVASCNDESLTEDTEENLLLNYIDISSVDLVNGITKIDILDFKSAPSRARRIVRDGDTIISTVRTYLKAICGINEPEENTIVSTGFAVLRPTDKIYYNYLKYYSLNQYFIDSIVAHSKGVSYPAINPSDLTALEICYPPNITDQVKITDYIDSKINQLDDLVKANNKGINNLQEYRSALITSAVTGQIDVRNVKIPQEIKE